MGYSNLRLKNELEAEAKKGEIKLKKKQLFFL